MERSLQSTGPEQSTPIDAVTAMLVMIVSLICAEVWCAVKTTPAYVLLPKDVANDSQSLSLELSHSRMFLAMNISEDRAF